MKISPYAFAASSDWFAIGCGVERLKRINCYALYALGRHLGAIVHMDVSQWGELSAVTIHAIDSMEQVFWGDSATDPLMELDIAKEEAQAVMDELNRLHDGLSASPIVFGESDLKAIQQSIGRLEIILKATLSKAATYYVGNVGAYDPDKLIDGNNSVFDPMIKNRLPRESLDDTAESSRALAFGLATASGFHIARALESIMKEQMTVFGCAPPKNSQRNWGQYIDLLTAAGANTKILHHLAGIKDLYRNPLIHPEVTLTMVQANQLWSLCTSLIPLMVADMETRRPSPDPEILKLQP